MGPKPKPTPEKYCAFCGKKMERKSYPNGKEDIPHFLKRKYCDIRCMKKAFVCKDGSKQTYRGTHQSSYRIMFTVEEREKKCEICGSSISIDVHHKDGNCHNNSLDNLMVVCRSCHMKLHNPKPKCLICGRPVKGHGLCDKHYQRLKKHGDPNHIPWSTYNRKQI